MTATLDREPFASELVSLWSAGFTDAGSTWAGGA